MKCNFNFKLPEPMSLNDSDEGRVAKIYHRSNDMTQKQLLLLQQYIV